MAMVVLDDSCTTGGLTAQVRVAWSEGRRPLVRCSAIHQMNQVNSCNGLAVVMTAL